MFKKFSKKYFFLFSSLLALFFLSIPVLQPAQANIGGWLFNILGIGVSGITFSISVVLHTFLLMSWGILGLVASILQWTLSNPLTYSLTNPASNPVINVGWTLLRDLTNMGFVIGLAYIGLATALNLNNFQTKKTFGRFIVAALLINFTPVICGVIVDASNILMTFFTKEIGTNFNQFSTLYSGINVASLKDLGENLFLPLGLARVVLALTVNIVTAIILFVFSFLFLARNIAIWILVIISPIAFFCWIFDGTRSTFNKWWSQFLHWSFIGVLAGFALYLSAFLLSGFKDGLSKSANNIFEGGVNDFVSLAPPIIVIIFMSFAFAQVMKSSAAGGNMVIGAAKTVGSGIASQGKRAGLSSQRWLRNKGAMLSEGGKASFKIPFTNKNFSLGTAGVGTAIRYMSGRGTTEERKTWDKGGHKWIRRLPFIGASAMIGRRFLAEGTEQEVKEAEKIKKKAAGKSVEMQGSLLEQAILPGTKGAIISQIQEDGNANDVANMPKGEELEKLLGKIVQSNAALLAKSLRFLDPKATANAITKLGDKISESQKAKAGLSFSEADKKAYGTLEGKILSKMKQGKLEYMDEDAADRYVGAGGLGHKFFTGAIMSKGAELFGRKFIDNFLKNSASQEWYKEHNLSLYNWAGSAPARGLGVTRANLGSKGAPEPVDPTSNKNSSANNNQSGGWDDSSSSSNPNAGNPNNRTDW